MVTACPHQVPVKPSIPRTSFTHFGLSRNVSAAHFARYGSPGIKIVSAISPGVAPIWSVISNLQIFHSLAGLKSVVHPIRFATLSRPGLFGIVWIFVFRSAFGALLGRAPKQFIQRKPVFLRSRFRGLFGFIQPTGF